MPHEKIEAEPETDSDTSEIDALSSEVIIPPEENKEDEPPISERPSLTLGPLTMLGLTPQPDEKTRGKVKDAFGILVQLAAFAIVVAALKTARPFLVPLVAAAFLATLTAPIVFYLRKKRVPALLGVPLVVLAALIVGLSVASLLVGSLNTFIQAAPAYQQTLTAQIDLAVLILRGWGIDLTSSGITRLIQPSAAVQFAGQTLGQVADFVSTSLLIVLLTIFLLFEALVLPLKIRLALSDPNADMSQGLRILSRVKDYVVVKTLTSLVTGVVIWGLLSLLQLDFALLWGLLAFLFNFIPNIGSMIAAIPAIIVALLQLGIGGAVSTSIIFFTVNMVIGSFIEPRVMGQRMNLSPLIVFISLLFWGWLWGPIGMLLSVPLTMVVRIYLDGNERTRPFAILMAGAKSNKIQ